MFYGWVRYQFFNFNSVSTHLEHYQSHLNRLLFQDKTSLVKTDKIHNLHNFHMLQCIILLSMLWGAFSRHKGTGIMKTSCFVAEGGSSSSWLIKANRVHCKLTFWVKGVNNSREALKMMTAQSTKDLNL
jgi:hypothetical protein